MKPFIILVALCSLALLTGCQSELPMRNAPFLLSAQDIRNAVEASRQGDARSAYKLYLHYTFGLGYPEMGNPWKVRAKELGYSPQ